MHSGGKTNEELERANEAMAREMEDLRARLTEAEEALAAIRNGEVDALLIAHPDGDRIYALEGVDTAYRVLVENMREGAVTLLDDGSILYANQCFADMIGQSLEKILGMAFDLLVHPDDENVYQALRQACRQKHSAGEIRLVPHDGSPLHVYLSLNILQLQDMQSTCMVVTDLSAQKRNQQIAADERLARAILEQAGECIVVCDQRGMIVRANEEARRICGRNPLLQPFADVFQLEWEDEPATHEDAPIFSLDSLLSQPPLRNHEVRYRQSSGRLYHFLLNAGVLRTPEGENLGSVVSLTNITERKQAEEDVRRHREWLRVTLTSIGDAVIACDQQSRITFFNPVAAALTGWQEEQALGQPVKNVFKIINEKTRQPTDDIVMRVLRERRVFELSNHTALVTQDGREIPVEDCASPILDSAGAVAGVVLVFHDVTEKRRALEALRESERRYSDMLSNVELISLMLDREGQITFCNDYLLRLTGWRREEVLGAYWFDRFIPPGSDEVKQAHSALLENQPSSWHHENEILTRFGERRLIRWNNTVLRSTSGEVVGTASIGEDITERQQAEEALRQANEQLLEADRQKDEFLAMLAHELRNPLAPVRSAAEIIRLKTDGDPGVQRQNAIIDRQISHMSRLLDDLLDVSRITRGKIEIKREMTDLCSVLRRTAETCHPALEQKNHKLDLRLPEDPLWVIGDPTRLEQIFTNLLINSCKYMEPGGRIALSACWTRSDAQRFVALVSVRDWGIGIEPKLLPHIFGLFVQSKQGMDRSQGGLGIGLTMVKRLLDLHGGRIEAHSAGPDKGSEFLVHLPLAEHPEEAYNGSETAPGQASSKELKCPPLKILVVDDIPDTVQSMAELLELEGHQVRMARDGAATLEVARTFSPEVVLLDIGLPGMNGYEVAERLRQEGSRAALVALTGYGQDTDRNIGYEVGFSHYLIKPVDLATLHRILFSIANTGQ